MSDGTTTMDAPRDWKLGIARGLKRRCPACGKGALFERYLKVAPVCASCGEELHHHRADDLPPYLTMFVVAKLVGYGVYVSEMRYEPSLAFHMATWPALTVALCLALLPPFKGAVVGLQHALGMHGFAGPDQYDPDLPHRERNDADEPRERLEGPRA